MHADQLSLAFQTLKIITQILVPHRISFALAFGRNFPRSIDLQTDFLGCKLAANLSIPLIEPENVFSHFGARPFWIPLLDRLDNSGMLLLHFELGPLALRAGPHV